MFDFVQGKCIQVKKVKDAREKEEKRKKRQEQVKKGKSTGNEVQRRCVLE